MFQAYVVYLLLMSALVVTWRLVPAARYGINANSEVGGATVLAMAISVLLYGLVLGMRYNVGGDYEGYVNYYLGVTDRVTAADVPYEWGFYWLIRVLRAFQLPPAALFLSTCVLQMLFMVVWLRRYPDLAPWYVYFFFTSLLVFESMNTIRQALAYAVVLSAMPVLHRRRLVLYVLMVVGASLVHSSALLFLPLYFVLDRDWLLRPRFQVTLLLLAYVTADAAKDALFELLPLLTVGLNYGGYADVQDALFFEGEVTGFSAGVIFMILADLFIMLSSPMLRCRFSAWGFRIYYNLYIIGALITPVVFYSNYIPFQRMVFYFTAFRPVVLSFVMVGWLGSDEGRSRPGMRLIAWAFVAAYLLWFLLAIWKKAAWCAPFQFVLQ